MAQPCAVFWDTVSMDVPKDQSVDIVVNLIRSTIIKPYNLNETFFFCVCDSHQLLGNVNHLNVDIVQTHSEIKNSADLKIMDLMRKFVAVAGQDCTFILISGDGDYYDTLNDLKKLHNVSIHLVSLTNSFSTKLDPISDYKFMLHKGILKLVKSRGLPMYFISIKNYPLTMDIKLVMDNLNSQTSGSIQRSAIYFDDSIYIGFPTLWFAERAIEQLDRTNFYGSFLKVELIGDSPLADILKCIKSTDEAKQLTFIEMNDSKEAVDQSKIIKFFTACNSQSDIQCILSIESFLWIIFSNHSYAQKFLSLVQIIYPDANISEPSNALTLMCNKDQYTVESWEQIVTNGKLKNVSSSDTHDGNDLRIFFQYKPDFVAPVVYYKPTKWLLLYNLFEQLYDLGAKKVIFYGDLYCASFDFTSTYQNVVKEMRSRNLEPLEYVNAPEDYKQKVIKIMDRYMTGISWCLNQELDLICLLLKIDSKLHNHFIEISKNSLANRDCIFIKSKPGEIWIGFPDELICKNSLEIVFKNFLPNIGAPEKPDYWIIKPSSELLESINFSDLAGDAYDLAFLSNQLEILKPITKPIIIERIISQRIDEKECNESVFCFEIHGRFHHNSWPRLQTAQIVKVLVKFSKVIPLAVTVFLNSDYYRANFIYNSWHEAYVADHFTKKLYQDVPYFQYIASSGVNKYSYLGIFECYLINDKRKVIDKIGQNKSSLIRLKPNSAPVQITPEINVKDEEINKKSQHIFVITTNSDFKFINGMTSIIKMHLIQMKCPVSIEFEDKIWVGVDDLEKGNKAKAEIEKMKFNILNENDDDFTVGIEMQLVSCISSNVAKMLENKLINPTKAFSSYKYLNSKVCPLGHFNYNYRKAVGMSISRYCQLNKSV